MKKIIYFLLFLIFIFPINVHAKNLKECIYEDTMNKVIIKIDSNYEATAFRYGFNDPRFDDKPYKHELQNWNNANIDKFKSTNECPKYIVQGQKLNSFDWTVKTWVYYDEKEKEKKLKEFDHWYATGTSTMLSKSTNSGSNIIDKEDGSNNVSNNKNEDIKEFKKTYKLGNFSSSVNGDEVILYTKYNFTNKTFLSTQIEIPNYDGNVGLVYNGDINNFKNNVLSPIVNDNKWPDNMYCGQISATLKVSPSSKVILGTANNGDIVCSTDKSNFIDSNNNLSGFENSSGNTTSQKCEEAGKGGCLTEDSKVEEVSDICSILTPDMLELLKDIIGYIQIGTVFLALVLGILDFVGAIGSDKDNAFKDAGKKFLKRLVAVALVFLVPALLGIILNFVSVANDCHLEIFG